MQNGGRVCNLSIATSESWKDKTSGQRVEKTEWHRVVIFNDNLVTIAEKYVRKGSKVYIEGALETRKWQDQQGVEKYSTEIVLKQFRGELTLLDSKKDVEAGDYPPPAASRQASGSASYYGAAASTPHAQVQASSSRDLDNSIPF